MQLALLALPPVPLPAPASNVTNDGLYGARGSGTYCCQSKGWNDQGCLRSCNRVRTNATEAWDDERQELLMVEDSAHEPLGCTCGPKRSRRRHGDWKFGECSGRYESYIVNALKVKALRKVKDKGTATQRKPAWFTKLPWTNCKTWRWANQEYTQSIRISKGETKTSKSQLKAMLAIGAHVGALAKNAVLEDDAHVALKLRTTSLAAEAGIHVKKYIKAKSTQRCSTRKAECTSQRTQPKAVVEKTRIKPRGEEKRTPSWRRLGGQAWHHCCWKLESWGTGSLMSPLACHLMRVILPKRGDLPAAVDAEQRVDGRADNEPGKKLHRIVAVWGAEKGCRYCQNGKRNVRRPKKNVSAASSGASGPGDDAEEEADAISNSGASGPEMKSLTRTFVSDGATSTVTTVSTRRGSW